MRNLVQCSILLCAVLLASVPLQAQWRCVYATYDDDVNGTGSNTISVGVIRPNTFVALVASGRETSENLLVPYVNADSAQGRLYYFGYGGDATGKFQVWSDGGFDQVTMVNAYSVCATPDSFIYIANNDPSHNILVFKLINDTITVVPHPANPSTFPRQETGANRIHAVEVDGDGYVYVCTDTTSGIAQDIKIYPPISQWNASHNNSPVATVDLPDGIYKGLAVNANGSVLWVCDYANRSIVRYTGSRTSGYTKDNGFNFSLTPADTIPGATGRPGPVGLKLMQSKNILFAAVDSMYGGSASYDYGRIYLVNAFTGALVSQDLTVSMIDVAQWNFDAVGAYNNRINGTTPGNMSGYTSTYDVELDAAGYLYSQSYYGWTVEKWEYLGTLPTVTGVEQVGSELPRNFRLEQNYPNPFNPTTTIEFTVLTSGYVSLRIHDVLGREVAVLVDREMTPGTYRATFDARDLPGGTYLYTFRSGNVSVTKKMVLVR